MAQDRLTSSQGSYHHVAPEPSGIRFDLTANGIDTSGKAPAAIVDEVRNLGAAIVGINESNDPTLDPGSIVYSERRIEAQLESISKDERRKTESAEELHLNTLAANPSPTNPVAALAAGDTLTDAGGINPHARDTYFANQAQLENYEAAGIRNLTTAQKNAYKNLKSQQRILRRRHSDQTVGAKTRQFFRSRADVSARKGMNLTGGSEESIASVLEGRGRTKPIRQYAEAKEDRKRAKAESEQPRNIVSRKGTIITVNGRRHVVSDTISTPAQAHKVDQVVDGKPVYMTDPSTGQPALFPMYRAILNPKTKKIEYGTDGKVKIEPAPMPRDDSYRSGLDKNTGENKILEQFYYQDGTPVHTEAWGADSFNPIDDIVVLKPLLTGAEAFNAIVNGTSTAGIDLRDFHTPLKRLTSLVSANPKLLEDEESRDILLNELLVFAKSDPSTPRTKIDPKTKKITVIGARAPKDQLMDTGHFRRFDYVDPRTSRQITISNYIEKYARQRIQENLKKGKKARTARLS